METLTIKIKGKNNLEFMIKLLNKFDFVELDKNRKIEKTIMKTDELPVVWSKSAPDIDDFNDVWKGRKLNIQEIRSKAWKRS
jgi:hypothetical protein